MPSIPDSYLDVLIEKNDIVDVVNSYVPLQKKGANYWACCPFHGEKTPSFSVNPSRGNHGIFKCFGCGKSGGVIRFVMEIERVEFREAVEILAKRAGMDLPEDEDPGAKDRAKKKKRLYALNKDAALFFMERLRAQIAANKGPGLDYMRRRGINDETRKNFGIGYAPDEWRALYDAMAAKGYNDEEMLTAGLIKRSTKGNVYDTFRSRLVFPIIDVKKNVLGFSGRIIGEGDPKYYNSPDTLVFKKGENVFTLNLAKNSKRDYFVLVEGNLDVASLHQAGIDSAVASLGTALTPEQARLLMNYQKDIVLCYDSDNAGRNATEKAIKIFDALGAKVRVIHVPDGKDPDEFIRKNGAAAFENLLTQSEGTTQYRLGVIKEKYDLTQDEQKLEYEREAIRMLASLPGPAERELYAGRVASDCGLSREVVSKEVEYARKNYQKNQKKKEQRESSSPVRNVQPKDRSLRYENPQSARAEEGIISLLYIDPALADSGVLPPAEDFSSGSLRRIYEYMLGCIRDERKIDPDYMAQEEFTPAEIDLFTGIIGGTVDMTKEQEALQDYKKAMKDSHRKEADPADLLAQRRAKEVGTINQ